MTTKNYQDRTRAIHLLRQGITPKQVAVELNRSLSWVYKWRLRYKQGGWAGLQDLSRAPKQPAHTLPASVKAAIRKVRSQLEAEACMPDKLSYIGSQAILSRLRREQVSPLPCLSSIERELRTADMVKSGRPTKPLKVDYPHIKPIRPHQLVQVDIVPRHLPGGQRVACFNAIDVVSRYPTGQALPTKRSGDAVDFLLHVWRELGIPDYTQVDNESCFSGGFSHAKVLGRVLRLGLWVGTQLVFSPIYHPESNGYVERFHQDYTAHVWDKHNLTDLSAVQRHAVSFFTAYRQSEHHSALQGQSPSVLHHASATRSIPEDLALPTKFPLTVGKVHFMRRVTNTCSIHLLNADWKVATAEPDRDVWATLEFNLKGAWLAIFDVAPGVPGRHCLARHLFPTKETVQPLQECFRHPASRETFVKRLATRSARWLSSML